MRSFLFVQKPSSTPMSPNSASHEVWLNTPSSMTLIVSRFLVLPRRFVPRSQNATKFVNSTSAASSVPARPKKWFTEK